MSLFVDAVRTTVRPSEFPDLRARVTYLEGWLAEVRGNDPELQEAIELVLKELKC